MYKHFFCQEIYIYSIIIESENDAVYAYLLKDDNIVGDVWLYNETEDPLQNQWETNIIGPYKNSIEYIKLSSIKILDINNVNNEWIIENNKLIKVKIYSDNKLIAILKDGHKPGFCVNAKIDGPLALSNIEF